MKLLLALLLAAFAGAPAVAASVDGLQLHYTVQGEGKTIIFIHGWTCDETSWSRQVPEFAEGYRVVTLDLPGHGKSDAPAQADFSMDLFAAAVEAVRSEIGAERVVLVGHSMGAVVLRQYALAHPAHVAGLVAVDGLLDVRPFAAYAARAQPMTHDRRIAAIEGMFVEETPEALREEIRAMMLATPEATAIGANGTIIDPAIQSSRIIAAPAMTVWAGTRNAEDHEATRELLPAWEGHRIAGTGHFLMMEKPGEFNALLQDFLERRADFGEPAAP